MNDLIMQNHWKAKHRFQKEDGGNGLMSSKDSVARYKQLKESDPESLYKDVTDEAGCDAVQGTWIEDGDPLTGCQARSDVVGALYLGDGTEAAALVCGILGEGSQCQECGLCGVRGRMNVFGWDEIDKALDTT